MPGGLARVLVCVADGVVASIDTAREGATVIGARGQCLAPAMVDLHADAFERQLTPRPGGYSPLERALPETDRQLAANGNCHSVTYPDVQLGTGVAVGAIRAGHAGGTGPPCAAVRRGKPGSIAFCPLLNR